jgi:hypothetical protein
LGTRGLFRFTSTDWPAMHAAGFNASTDGGVQDAGDAQAANGIAGMVWVDPYDNTSCAQTMTDSAIAALPAWTAVSLMDQVFLAKRIDT